MKPETEAACHAALYALGKAALLLENDAKEAVSIDNPPDLVRYYADLREQAEDLRDAVALLSKIEQNLSYQQIPLAFDRAGIQSVRVVGYGLVGLTRKWSCSFLEGKKDEGFAWLREHGQGGMIIETIPAPTLGAWAHAVTDETGVEPNPEIFKTSIARSVSLRRSK